MKISVVGAGAVGSHVAAWLARGGLDVSVVARGPALQALRERGLRFESAHDTFTVRPRTTDDGRTLGAQDVVLVALKANALPGAVDSLLPLVAPGTLVVYALNGIPWWYEPGTLPGLDPQGRLQRELGVKQAIGCVVFSPNVLVAPGVVHNGSASNRFLLGEPVGGASERLDRLVSVLQPALPGAQASPALRGDIWRKLLLNVPESALSVLTASEPCQFRDEPRMRALYARLAQETADVAGAEGWDVQAEVEQRVAQMGLLQHTPSMLQDLRAGRPIESDAQVGAVHALAQRHGIATPTLDMLLPLLEQRARTGRG